MYFPILPLQLSFVAVMPRNQPNKMNYNSSDVFLSNLECVFLLHPSYFHLLKTGSSSLVNFICILGASFRLYYVQNSGKGLGKILSRSPSQLRFRTWRE